MARKTGEKALKQVIWISRYGYQHLNQVAEPARQWSRSATIGDPLLSRTQPKDYQNGLLSAPMSTAVTAASYAVLLTPLCCDLAGDLVQDHPT